MSTVAYQGRGSSLNTSDLASPPTLTKIAQLQKFAFSGMSATLEDITNLDSPTAFKEVLPTVIDPKDITFDGICDPANTAWGSLATYLQGRTLKHWEIVLTNGTTLSFDGYVTEFVPVSVDAVKALVFSGKISITGAVVITT